MKALRRIPRRSQRVLVPLQRLAHGARRLAGWAVRRCRQAFRTCNDLRRRWITRRVLILACIAYLCLVSLYSGAGYKLRTSDLEAVGRPDPPLLPVAIQDSPQGAPDANQAPAQVSPLAPEPFLREGIALCLSGGGYRAMLFHAGALWRLNDAGCLPKLRLISSVSGGAVTAAVLGMNWDRLDFGSQGVARNFKPLLIDPIRALASKTVDIPAVAWGVATPRNTVDGLVSAYRAELFGEKTLQDLPDVPRFCFNATNLQTGHLWRMSKPYMGEWEVGRVLNPRLDLAIAVAASSAFPPFLAPLTLDLRGQHFVGDIPERLEESTEYQQHIVLADGGIWDNFGIEPAKSYETLLVSDAGGIPKHSPRPGSDWLRLCSRVVDIIYAQPPSFRKRLLIDSFAEGRRKGAYWGIGNDLEGYQLADAFALPEESSTELARISTRLAALEGNTQESLINWGYACADAALRRHLDASLQRPTGLPYRSTATREPGSGVGPAAPKG